MENLYLNASQAARYVGLSESYLAKLRMGTLAEPGPVFCRIGQRAIRYRTTDLDVWMKSKRTSEIASLEGASA